MSIPVDVAKLEAALADFGAGYLLSTAAHGRVKAVTVEPRVMDGALIIAGPGGGSSRNIAENAQVTVLFPPLEARGYTLLIDGLATVEGDDARVVPSSAVLHRPADHSDGPGVPGGCGHDCGPV
ncbi:hypothetical protein GCM10027020_14980 [Nocardioides salsibiostraticola]